MRRREVRSRQRGYFEQLERREMLTLVGDAPAPYPDATVTASVGPRLGDSRSIDDGVTFGTLRVGQLDAQLELTIAGANSGSMVDAWIDFDQDGSFSGAAEQILDAVEVSNGTMLLEFDIPAIAEDGTTYARFRVSDGAIDGGVGQGGDVDNGEVEDYAIEILAPAITDGTLGSARTVTSSGVADGVADVLAADIDGDGQMDIVSSSYEDGEIAVYRANSSISSWSRTVVGNVADNNSGEFSPVGLAVGDLDGDGDLDLASASATDDTIAWYRNDTTGSSLSFTKFTIFDEADGARAVVVADFDQDGQLDLGSVSLIDDTIRVHRNTDDGGNSQFETMTAAFALGNSELSDIYAVDINRDGFIDLVSISANANDVFWHRNDGTPFVGAWTVSTLINNGPDASDVPFGSGVFAGFVDSDTHIDVVYTSFGENRADWSENPGSSGSWSGRNSVDTGLDGANPPFVADVDGDGDMDVVVPGYIDNNVTVHLNDGSGGFTLSDTTSFFSTPTNLVMADIDGDGALDLVVGGDVNDRISWFTGNAEAPEILVTGDGLTISDGDSSPRTADGTDYGAVTFGAAGVLHDFIVTNTGTGTLFLGELTLPDGFQLEAPYSPVLLPDESTVLSIGLITTTLGFWAGDVSLDNNDSSEAPYNFEIRGSVVTVLGDYNFDERVNLADYTVWRNTLGAVVPRYTGADGNGNGVVDVADYTVWKDNFGETLAAAATSAPAAIASPATTPSQPSEQATTSNTSAPTAQVVIVPQSDGEEAGESTDELQNASPASPPLPALETLLASEVDEAADNTASRQLDADVEHATADETLALDLALELLGDAI